MFRQLIGILAPSLTRKRKRRRKTEAVERVSATNFAPTGGEGASGPKVLLTDLANDDGGAATARLGQAFGGCDALEVFRSSKVLKQPKAANVVQSLLGAAEEGRRWLTEHQADVLVWGEVNGSVLRLRYVPMVPCADNLPGAFGLGDTLKIPEGMIEQGEALLQSSVLAAVGPTFSGLKTRIAEALGQAMQGARDLAQNQPEGMNSQQHATVLINLGHAFAVQYRLTQSAKNLESAQAVYRSALKKINVDSDPDCWAVAQSHYATALKARAQIEKNDDLMNEAAVAYREITEKLGRVSHPDDWALAHINHGLVLYRMSVRTGRAAYLQEAGKSFEEALTVYSKETMPGRWAEVMNQYGVILLALGEQVTGNVTLELAVKKFRKALEIRKRYRAPQLWAQTANNLGAACFSLAKRNAEVALLREATACFEGAVEVYQETGAAKRAEVIKSNLARVQRLLTARAS